MKHKQNFQEGQFLRLKNKNLLNSVEVLEKIKYKMQLDSIRLEDLECLKELFEQEKRGASSWFLRQIKHAFIDLGCENDISISELEYLAWNAENKIVAEYIKIIRKEMQANKVNNLIF